MSLAIYKKKRSFNRTPEPSGEKNKAGSALHFVVQKHDASQLHYDFRLEMNGVLKSWAIPKGPSLNPDIKRLAIMVEDHPFDYRNFEGIIPEGNYGAGVVMIWDEGVYRSADINSSDIKLQEKNILQQLHNGKLNFILEGSKLKGEFVLVKSHGLGENDWLFMKVKDRFASSEDITKKDKSVKSKKTLEQIATTSKNFHKSNRIAGKTKNKKSTAKQKQEK